MTENDENGYEPLSNQPGYRGKLNGRELLEKATGIRTSDYCGSMIYHIQRDGMPGETMIPASAFADQGIDVEPYLKALELKQGAIDEPKKKQIN